MVEFTDKHRELLREARKHRSECVLEIGGPADLGLSLWRSTGGRWDGPIYRNGKIFGCGGGGWGNGRDINELLTALRTSRILGLGDPGTEWVDELSRANGIPVTWGVGEFYDKQLEADRRKLNCEHKNHNAVEDACEDCGATSAWLRANWRERLGGKHGLRITCGTNRVNGSLDSRIAASKADQARALLDRPIPTARFGATKDWVGVTKAISHPPCWPEDSGEEL